MKIIEPQVEVWQQTDPITHVAKCARVCYGNKVVSDDDKLYNSLAKSKHNSMFRHQSVYAIIPADDMNNVMAVDPYNNNPYIDIVYPNSFVANRIDNNIYVATNQNFMIDHRQFQIWSTIVNYEVTPEKFNATEIGHSMMRYTFHIITQISTSRELNRVSPNNIAERSTRYIDESDGAICRPHWMSETLAAKFNEGYGIGPLSAMTPSEDAYIGANLKVFAAYKELVNSGIKRQDARGVLPLDTATEVVYTYSVNEWKHIIELRSAKNAHPNSQIIANMIKNKLKELKYDIQ